jgi:predicted DNA-binding ribbon-helix-helix protein
MWASGAGHPVSFIPHPNGLRECVQDFGHTLFSPGAFTSFTRQTNRELAMKSAVIKRSIAVNGRKTSVSLEDTFWDGLREVADKEKTTPAKLVGQIAHTRTTINLSSAIRIYLLCYFMGQFGAAISAGLGNSLAIASNRPSDEKELMQSPLRI